jgi:hypothetical protein
MANQKAGKALKNGEEASVSNGTSKSRFEVEPRVAME